MDTAVLQIGIQILALIFAVSVHESAHGWVAWRCGDPTARDLGRISLNPLRHIDPVGSVLMPGQPVMERAPPARDDGLVTGGARSPSTCWIGGYLSSVIRFESE